MDIPPAHAAQASGPEQAIVQEINAQRQRRGLRVLRLTSRLNRAARAHTGDMLRHDRLTHDGSDGTPYSRRVGRLGFRAVGEALAWVPRSADSSPSAIVRYWLDSPAHRRELLDPSYRRIGIGRALGAMGSERGVAATVDVASAR